MEAASLDVARYALCTLRDCVVALKTDSAPAHTPDAIKSLYHTVRKQSELYLLSNEEFGILISFYGSLSVLSGDVAAEAEDWITSSTFRLHPVASTIAHGSHWSFVLKLAYDMKACGRKLTVQDRFWLMRAALANIMVLSRQQRTAGMKPLCASRPRLTG